MDTSTSGLREYEVSQWWTAGVTGQKYPDVGWDGLWETTRKWENVTETILSLESCAPVSLN